MVIVRKVSLAFVVVVVVEPLHVVCTEMQHKHPYTSQRLIFFIVSPVASAAVEDRSDRTPSSAGKLESVLLLQIILAYFVKESRNAGF